MKFKIINKILAISVIIINFYFLPFTIIQIYSTGGAMGFGLLAVPFTFTINLFLISAFYSLKKRNENHKTLITLNAIGLILGIAFLLKFIVK